MSKHRCGGNLTATRVNLERTVKGLHYLFNVPGKRCGKCYEEVVSSKVVRSLDSPAIYSEKVSSPAILRRGDLIRTWRGTLWTAQTPQIWMEANGSTSAPGNEAMAVVGTRELAIAA